LCASDLAPSVTNYPLNSSTDACNWAWDATQEYDALDCQSCCLPDRGILSDSDQESMGMGYGDCHNEDTASGAGSASIGWDFRCRAGWSTPCRSGCCSSESAASRARKAGGFGRQSSAMETADDLIHVLRDNGSAPTNNSLLEQTSSTAALVTPRGEAAPEGLARLFSVTGATPSSGVGSGGRQSSSLRARSLRQSRSMEAQHSDHPSIITPIATA
jgi:hypothetical protein